MCEAEGELASILMERGDLDAAEALVRRALERECRVTGGGSRRAANSLAALSRIATNRGDVPEGIRLGMEAVQLWREHVGDRHPAVAGAKREVAVAYRQAALVRQGGREDAGAHLATVAQRVP